MKQIVTSGVVLSRINYGEADRIITVLTPDNGKLRLMVKGARRPKSKLAGGIELFSVSDITFIRGRGDFSTLVSARLKSHFANIVKDIDRVSLGYEILKILDRNTEDEVETDYYEVLVASLEALDDAAISSALIRVYFGASLLNLAGLTPNLTEDSDGQVLEIGSKYNFDAASARFVRGDKYSARHIKFLRLVFAKNSPKALTRIDDVEAVAYDCLEIISAMTRTYLRS